MALFKEVVTTLLIVLLARTCECVTATLGSLKQTGQCNSSVFKLGSLAVVPSPKGSIEGTFEVITKLDENYRVSLNVSKLVPEGQQFRKVTVSARSGEVCSTIGGFMWLLQDIKIKPQVFDCPIPVGKYTVTGFQFDNDLFRYYEMGSYEIDMQLFHQDQIVCGANVDMKLA